MNRLLNRLLTSWTSLPLWRRFDAWLDRSILTVHFVPENSTPQSEDRLVAPTLTDMRLILSVPDSALRARSAKLSQALEFLSTSSLRRGTGSTSVSIHAFGKKF